MVSRAIRNESSPRCPCCGAPGSVIYHDVTDRTFGVPGSWNVRRCERCFSLWLDPRPLADDRSLAYGSYFTHDRPAAASGFAGWLRRLRDAGEDAYIGERLGYRTAPPSLAARITANVIRLWAGRRLDAEFKVMRLRCCEGGDVLDVGAGDGSALADLRRFGWNVRGLEPDERAAATARARGIAVDVGDLTTHRYPDASFDAVVMSHVLEHVEEPERVLGEISRVLRPNGQFVAVTPNADSLLHRRYGRDWQGLEPPRHLQIFTPAAAKRIVEEAGFGSVEVVTTARGANGIARAAWKFRRDGRWDMRSRPSLGERIVMELIQEWEALVLASDPNAGEEIVVTAERT